MCAGSAPGISSQPGTLGQPAYDLANFQRKAKAMTGALLKCLGRMRVYFDHPVEPDKVPGDYFTIVKHPMDLGTIREALQGGQHTPTTFHRVRSGVGVEASAACASVLRCPHAQRAMPLWVPQGPCRPAPMCAPPGAGPAQLLVADSCSPSAARCTARCLHGPSCLRLCQLQV